MPDDNNMMAERLGRALEGEARRDPLPFDFVASIAASLEDCHSRRFSWFSGVPTIAVTVALVAVAVAVPLSLNRPSTTPGSGGSEPAVQQPSVAVTASATPPTPTASATTDASPQGLTKAEAVEAARTAAGRPDMTAVHVESGPAGEVLPREGFEFANVPSEDTWVWLVNLSDGGPPLGAEGSIVVLDYFDATIYGVMNWIS